MAYPDFLDSNLGYGSPITPLSDTPTAKLNDLSGSGDGSHTSKLVGALQSPFENMQNNWHTMTAQFGKGGVSGIVGGLADAYALAHNPTGSWGQQPQQPSGTPTPVKLTDEHLGEPNEHGVRPIQDSGFKHIDDTLKNTNQVSANGQPIPVTPVGQYPTADSAGLSQGQGKRGLIGNFAHNLATTAFNG